MAQTLYATAANLRDATSAVELAQVCTPAGHTVVDPTTFDGFITAGGVGAAGDFLYAYNNIVDAITRASSLMETRLRNRYTLPLIAPLPDVLRDYCCALARFDLNRNRATDEMRYRYEQAMKDLNAVAAGNLDIGATGTGNSGISAAGFGVLVSAPTRDNTYTTLSRMESQFPGGFVSPCR